MEVLCRKFDQLTLEALDTSNGLERITGAGFERFFVDRASIKFMVMAFPQAKFNKYGGYTFESFDIAELKDQFNALTTKIHTKLLFFGAFWLSVDKEKYTQFATIFTYTTFAHAVKVKYDCKEWKISKDGYFTKASVLDDIVVLYYLQ